MASSASLKDETLLYRELAEAHLDHLRETIAKTCNVAAKTQEVILSSWEAVRLAEVIRAAGEAAETTMTR